MPALVIETLGDIATCDNADALLDALKDCASNVLRNLERMGAILRRLDELGVEVAIDHALLPYIRMIANGQLSASCFIACGADPELLQKAVTLPPSVQEKIANDEPFNILNADGTSRAVRPSEMERREVSQVFASGRVRSEDEQQKWLAVSQNKSNAHKRRTNGEATLPARSDAQRQRHEEDLSLLAAHHAGDPSAMEKLLARYDALCWKIARRTAPHKENDADDYYQQARLFFVQYATAYDPASGVLLMTYVYRCVKGCMLKHFRRDSIIVHPYNQPVQFDSPTRKISSMSARDEDGKTLLELGKCDVDVEDSAELSEKLASVKEASKHLSDREREVVQRRLDGETLSDIAEDFGATKERIRQIEERATERLKRMASVHTDSLQSFEMHMSWLTGYLDRNQDRLTKGEIDALIQLSLKIDDLVEA